MSAIAKAWSIYRNRGLSFLAGAVGRKIYNRHKSIWFERRLDDTLEVIPGRFDGWMDFEHPEQVLAYIRERDIPGINDRIELASMLRRGQIFAGVMDGRNIIGFIKIGWETVYVLDYGIDITVRPGDFFVIDIYIGDEMRGRGAGPFLVSAASMEMKRRGFSRGVMHVRVDKTPMLKTCARTGYREIGRVDCRSVCGRKIFRPHPQTLIGASEST